MLGSCCISPSSRPARVRPHRRAPVCYTSGQQGWSGRSTRARPHREGTSLTSHSSFECSRSVFDEKMVVLQELALTGRAPSHMYNLQEAEMWVACPSMLHSTHPTLSLFHHIALPSCANRSALCRSKFYAPFPIVQLCVAYGFNCQGCFHVFRGGRCCFFLCLFHDWPVNRCLFCQPFA